MGLQNCGLNLNQQQRELQPHGTLDFPCAGYLERHHSPVEQAVPWHWHEELELIYLSSGELTIKTSGDTWHLVAGDFLAINSGVLHSGATDSQCQLHSLVFHPALVAGDSNSIYSKKYLTPLTASHSFRIWQFDKERDFSSIQAFLEAFDAMEKETPGFEFIVREKLSEICFALYLQFEKSIQTEIVKPNLDEIRIQKMMDFIHHNYAKNILLSDISKASDIGERECLRCFKKTIQTSPMQYLLKHRIMQGAEALLSHPADSISEIANSCGFDSPSNFSSMFKRFYNTTPREYRKINKA